MTSMLARPTLIGPNFTSYSNLSPTIRLREWGTVSDCAWALWVVKRTPATRSAVASADEGRARHTESIRPKVRAGSSTPAERARLWFRETDSRVGIGVRTSPRMRHTG